MIIVHKLYESYLLDQEMFITINDKVKITEFIINFKLQNKKYLCLQNTRKKEIG